MPYRRASLNKRFNSSADVRRNSPRFALYKRPLERVKQYTTRSNAYCSQSMWYNSATITAMGYGVVAPFPTTFRYGVTKSASTGCLMYVDRQGIDIPRYNPSGGQPRAAPLTSRFSDTIQTSVVTVARRLYNYTTTPFMVRTLVWHNTGRTSASFNFLTDQDYGALGRHGTSGDNGTGKWANVVSQCFQNQHGVDQTGVDNTAEQVRQVSFRYDNTDKRTDLLLDNTRVIYPVIESLQPLKEDGYANFPAGGLVQTSATHVRDSSSCAAVDVFKLPFKRRLRFEDEGLDVGCVQGDLVIVHLVVPVREPVPYIKATAVANLEVDPGTIGEFDIDHQVTVDFTDGS